MQVGRFHDKPIGPHPMWSCQITFESKDFDKLITWLAKNRKGLTVLVHGLSGNDLLDHTEHVYWLGTERMLNIDMFKGK